MVTLRTTQVSEIVCLFSYLMKKFFEYCFDTMVGIFVTTQEVSFPLKQQNKKDVRSIEEISFLTASKM